MEQINDQTAEQVKFLLKTLISETMAIDAGSFIEVVNEAGDKIILRFWQTRQSERQYPVDQGASDRYVNEVLAKIPTGKIKQ